MKVKLRAASGGAAPGGAFGGSQPVLKRSVAFKVWGDFPGAAFLASGLSGFVGRVFVPAKLAVCGTPELLTNTTLSPGLMSGDAGWNARTAVCAVLTPISTNQVVVPSAFIVLFGVRATRA